MPKKNKNQKNNEKVSVLKEQIKNVKQYLELDLSSKSAGGLLPYKIVLDSLSQVLELKEQNDESSIDKIREILLSVNKANLDLKINNIKKLTEKPLPQDLYEAKELYKARNKKYEERKNFHNKLVDKGNQMQEDRNSMIKKYEIERQNLIKESEQYVKDLQKKSDPDEPVRKKLLEENQKLKEDIQKHLSEGLKLKEDFDKQLKEGGLDIKKFEEKSKTNFQNKIESFQEKAQGGILLNTSLKNELFQVQQRNKELLRFKLVADEQYRKLQQEMKNKANESIMISTENIELQARINESQKNKEELYELINEKEKLAKKINVMKSLNDKYKSQYDELIGEKKKKKKKKNKKKKKKKEDKDKDKEKDKEVKNSTNTDTDITTTENNHNRFLYYPFIHNHDQMNKFSDSEKEQILQHHCCCCHLHH